MSFPTHIVSAGGIVEDGNGNILLVKAHDDLISRVKLWVES